VARRPTIADLARAAGVSVATVDRVLNARHRVSEPTAERVLGAAEAIGYHGTPLLKSRLRSQVPERTFAFLLQREDAFYAQFGADLVAATRGLTQFRARPVVDFAPDLSPGVTAERLLRLGESAHAVAVVSVDHPRVSDAIATLRRRGVPTFAILTELGAEAGAPYVGRDNRKEGRTAAWLIAKAARRPGKIGIIVGSHRFLCQETAEISFRAYLRENAPEFTPLEPLVNLEEPRIAYAATQDMIATHPDLVGLYICGGGKEGVIAGARDEPRSRGLAIICNELTPAARAGLIDGVLTAVISTPTALLAERALAAMAAAIVTPQEAVPSPIYVPFDLYLPTNV
jgi:LacI family transcriptional regulator